MEYRKLRGRIVEKFGTQGAFVDALQKYPNIGKSDVIVSAKLNGRVEFSKEDMLVWSRELEIPNSEFYNYFFT